jgi:hypothetical protein
MNLISESEVELACGLWVSWQRAAVLVVFAISGIFHEVCIGVPCHMLRCWAFLGIMLQVHLTFPYASHVLMPDHF